MLPRMPFCCFAVLWLVAAEVSAVELDERPARESEWGFRPAVGAVSRVNPPSFSWRPQRELVSWELECGKGADFSELEYRAAGLGMSVHCPPRAFSAPGDYTWRYRGVTAAGERTGWSRPRTFTISETAAVLPMPPRDELLGRIPRTHPRLFVRPEELPHLRQLAAGSMRREYEQLVERCERLLRNPPDTSEPPRYGPEIVRNSDPWREIWWGNRMRTIEVLDSAATLAFTRLLGGQDEYGQLARRILLECARWDPHGSTGYRYNDEAGMPYAYYFARTYSFVNDLLTEDEKALCRRVMKERGDEMYAHLYPRHLWQPYSSHSNRAWHFLGELGIAAFGEVEGAEDWVSFAMNVFYNVYPVWSDADGGWHEGFLYWSSYIGRFTWWADVMRRAMGVNAYDKPYFSQIGYYPMYLLPPGKVGGGFGDLNATRSASHAVPLVSQLAAQAQNGHWQWYVEHCGGPVPASGYIGFVRGALPAVKPEPPDDLPTSRLFRGTGQAVLNTSLRDAGNSVQVVFKSSPFGTQSHGYESNNAFLLWAYGQRLLIRSGYRDSYGSDHHRNWMWSTRSVNNITVNGRGQPGHSAAARGQITAFQTTPSVDLVSGEAGPCYRSESGEPLLERYSRTIVFLKPELVVVYDRLAARQPSRFAYWLHAVQPFDVQPDQRIRLGVEGVRCDIRFLVPDGLQFSQTNEYDPNPRPRITLREWHLTATTPRSSSTEFVAVYQPYREDAAPPEPVALQELEDGYVLSAELLDGQATILLPKTSAGRVAAQGLSSNGEVLVRRTAEDGSVLETVREGPSGTAARH